MEDDIKAVFGKVWPVHVHSLTRFLIDCRRTFNDDLELFLVLAVIGERTYSQQHADPSLDYQAFVSGKASNTPVRDINLRSIAEFSGIPRETVRRKIVELTENGWVTRNASGSIVATRKASSDLKPLTVASITYIAEMLRLLSDVVPQKSKGRKR